MTNNLTPQETIYGVVERITYFNADNGYSVIKLTPERDYPDAQARDGTIAVVGVMPEIAPGERLQLVGQWVNDARYGKQFKTQTVIPMIPDDADGLAAYLASGIVKGIGPSTAQKVVKAFGKNTRHVLDNEPDRLYTVLKKSLAAALIEAWNKNVAERQAMIFLQQFGVTARMARRIYNYYGSSTTARVQQNPYLMADDIFGIGFRRADQIAQRMGLATDSRERMRAGVLYALSELARDGHTYAPRGTLIDKVIELLAYDDDKRVSVAAAVDAQIAAREVVQSPLTVDDQTVEALYLPIFYAAEKNAAEHLLALGAAHSPIIKHHARTQWDKFLSELAEKNDISLSEQQRGAVKAALTSKLTVLTGGPGTGKTTTLRMVINALEHGKYKFALASPTGRAAKRLQEATGHDAYTLHRLLGFSPSEGGFTFNEDNPLPHEFLIVDEASMLDLMLFNAVLKALKPDAHLMLVGDVDQLPSVGAGNVLHDVIDSGVAHVTRLETIFRQGEDSHIIVNAHRINQGEAPYMDNRSEDFFFFTTNDSDTVADWTADMVIQVVTERLVKKFSIDPIRDVQVIAPMYRGAAGVNALNEALQAALNGNTRNAQAQIGGRVLRLGDKVMQTKNNYEREVFNGDIGYVRAIDSKDSTLRVDIDGRWVEYDYDSAADELILAYCISTHRSQGSEYPIVVMPILTQHYMMLQRNLLYTAVTRAKRACVLIGDRRAVFMAVKNNKVAERYSGLLPRLLEA